MTAARMPARMPMPTAGVRALRGCRNVVHAWIIRPPANDQFSHCVSLKQTMTFSAFNPGDCANPAMMSARIFRFTLTLRPTDNRISINTKSSVEAAQVRILGIEAKIVRPQRQDALKAIDSRAPDARRRQRRPCIRADLPSRSVSVTNGMLPPRDWVAPRGFSHRRASEIPSTRALPTRCAARMLHRLCYCGTRRYCISGCRHRQASRSRNR